ncbi:MAG: flagellar filament capping protein FliD [Verrucomicrobiales bacterium]|nr:flagellar filament capping protein FliD [Verrucomicrobiales bacterium]
MDLGVSGLASNFDWRSLIDQMVDIERLPQKRLLGEQNLLEQRKNAYSSIATQLGVLRNRISALREDSLYATRTTSSTDTTTATASAAAGSVQGTYRFAFQQLATAARHVGATGAGAALSTTSDVSGVVLDSAGFATSVTAGVFRVNGAEVTVATTDTLQGVFDKISTATGSAVTASYNATSDRIQLSSASPIVLGSATDTSNFLQVAQLYNNGTSSISSAGGLGSARLSATLSSANLSTTLTYGGSGAGLFKVNGVEIEYSSSDTLSTVLKRIGDSEAGVTASYDFINDRFVLANKGTGDVGIALEDVSGNFLAASKLSSGALERGKDLLYTVNGGGQLRSSSNTVTDASSGLTGLTVTALKESATADISVSSDTSKVRAAITSFIDDYNRVQSLISSQTESTTDADGKVETNTLTSEGDAESIASTLRKMVYSSVSGLEATMSHLARLGISTNSDDDTLELEDGGMLDEALATQLEDVQALWNDDAVGIATKLDEYMERLIGDDGSLVAKQDVLVKQASGIDVQVADLERLVQSNRQRLIDSFVAMEQAQSKINQQMQFLSQRYGISSTSS